MDKKIYIFVFKNGFCSYFINFPFNFLYIFYSFLIYFMQNRLFQDIVFSSHEAVPH